MQYTKKDLKAHLDKHPVIATNEQDILNQYLMKMVEELESRIDILEKKK